MEKETYQARPRRRKKKNWIPFITLLLACYVSVQIYLMRADSNIDTVKAAEGYINDSIISQGIICREETVLTKTGNGVVDYIAEDGERVSVGHLVANVYPLYSDIDNMRILRNRQSMLDDINLAAGYLENSSLDMSVTRKQLTGQLSRLSSNSVTSDFEKINDSLSRLTLSLNKIGVATGKITDFSVAESQINSEINSIESRINPVAARLYTPSTGYFLKSSDGYENVATVDNFLNLSYNDGISIIDGSIDYSPDSDAYGKIVTDYKWNICTYVDSSLAENMYEGMNISISINPGENKYYRAEVKQLVEKSEPTLVVIECSVINSDAVKTRITDCEILFKQYKGIKIPKTAIHFDEEHNMGVYVNFAGVVYFRYITPVYEDDNYVIVSLENSDYNEIKLHDSIIVKGRNLYYGKYL